MKAHRVQSKLKFSITVGILIMGLVFNSGQSLFAQASSQNVMDEIKQALSVSDGKIQPLNLSPEPVSGLLYVSLLTTENEYLTLELRPHSLRADDFKLFIDDGSGSLTRIQAPHFVTWKGSVLERPEARVSASFRNDKIHALILGPDYSYSVQPIEDAGAVAQSLQASNLHICYSGSEVIPTAGNCGNSESTLSPDPGGSGAAPFGPGVKIADIVVEADFEYFTQNGSSIDNTLFDMENLINSVDNVYRDPVTAIGYEISAAVIRSNINDPYSSTSSATMVSEFVNSITSGDETNIRRDVGHLFTGRNVSGSVIGRANGFALICNISAGYAFSQARYTSNFTLRSSLVAHELGHLWNAIHCNGTGSCHIMCSANGSCDGLPPLDFGPFASGRILNHRNSRTCLSDDQAPLSLPFSDDFSSGLTPDKWTYSSNHGITSSANSTVQNPPSGPLVLNLDSESNEDFDDNEARTNVMLLSGVNDPTLVYYTQHVGVESGEELVVEYVASNGQWFELTRHTSNGNDQSQFDMHSMILPLTARHNNFRLRFRTEGNHSSDDWYIDDVSISEGPPILIAPTLSHTFPISDTVEGGMAITVVGQDFDGDAVVYLGSEALIGQEVVSETEITGTVPPSQVSGQVDVRIEQAAGIDTLPGEFRFTDDVLTVVAGQAPAGQSVEVRFEANHEDDLSGFSFGVDFDSGQLMLDEVTLVGTLAEAAEFIALDTNFDPEPGGWFTIGVVMDFSAPINLVVPSGIGSLITLANFTIDPGMATGELLPVQLTPGLGNNIDITFVNPNALSISPARVDGAVEVIDGVSFVRGDANNTQTVDIADVVTNLNHQFSMLPTDCLDSLDVNDDGSVNISDPISLLDFLFSGGSAPPAPFPAAGSDPTPDGIDCNRM